MEGGQEIRYFTHPEGAASGPALAARAGDLVFYGGGLAAHPERGVPDEVKPLEGYPHHWSRINREANYILGVMRRVLEAAGSSMSNVMKLNSYHLDPHDVYEALRLRKDHFGTDSPPPSTLVLVPELPVRDARVVIDGIALTNTAARPRQALVDSTPGAPMPPHQRIWGHRIYSKATRGGGFIFTAGRTNNVIGAGSDDRSRGHRDFPYRDDRAVVATEVVLEYLRDVLRSWGASFDHVVKAEIHVNDVQLIAGIDEVWRRAFPRDPPARVFVPVAFPTEYTILEVELIAVDPDGPYEKSVIAVSDVPSPIGHEPQAVAAGPYLFLSGMLATDYRSGVAPAARVDPGFPYHTSAIARQVRYILGNLERLCHGAGASGVRLLRRRAHVEDLSDMGMAERVWRETLDDRLPPTTTIKVGGPLPVPGCRVQYDLVALIDAARF